MPPARDPLTIAPAAAGPAAVGPGAGAPVAVSRPELAASGAWIVARDVALVLLYWWLATGLLFLIQRDPLTRLFGVAGATALGGVGMWLVVSTRDEASARGALRAWLGAALLWGWPATLLYAGLPAGPADAPLRPLPFPQGSWPMAIEAVRATVVNDVIGVLLGVALGGLTWGRANRTAFHGYALFWLVQQAAKLNIFFGVAHAGAEFLPTHLRFLARYFGPAENAPLVWATLAALGLATVAVGRRAAASRSGHVRTGLALLTAVLALAVTEHLVLAGAFAAPLWKAFLDARGY